MTDIDKLEAEARKWKEKYNAALRALADQDCPDDVTECVDSTEGVDCAACWEHALASHEEGGE